MRSIVPVARLLFVSIFLASVPGHFQAQTIAYAAQAGVPYAGILVPLSGLLALAGGLSVLLGWHARVGAWLLVLFLVPVTLAMPRSGRCRTRCAYDAPGDVLRPSIVGGAL